MEREPGQSEHGGWRSVWGKQRVVDYPGRAAVKIACGYIHTCAILDEGSVVCWGDNGEGQLGNGRMGTVCRGWSAAVRAPIPVDLGWGRVRSAAAGSSGHAPCSTTVASIAGVKLQRLGYDMTKFGNLGMTRSSRRVAVHLPGGKAVKVYGTAYARCVIWTPVTSCAGADPRRVESYNSHGASV